MPKPRETPIPKGKQIPAAKPPKKPKRNQSFKRVSDVNPTGSHRIKLPVDISTLSERAAAFIHAIQQGTQAAVNSMKPIVRPYLDPTGCFQIEKGLVRILKTFPHGMPFNTSDFRAAIKQANAQGNTIRTVVISSRFKEMAIMPLNPYKVMYV
jgi:hypothetical protein